MFKDAFKDFLDAVSRKDWKGTQAFLDENLPLHVLLPGQNPIQSYLEFTESQKKYFEDPSALFEYQIIQTQESGDLGFGVAHCHLKMNPQDEETLRLQICFLFKKSGNSWKLTFDQNSILPSEG